MQHLANRNTCEDSEIFNTEPLTYEHYEEPYTEQVPYVNNGAIVLNGQLFMSTFLRRDHISHQGLPNKVRVLPEKGVGTS
jgi:hypothetical protein